jgi:PAS domain S-box-containing protein
MRHGLLEPASIQRLLYDALDQSDDFVLVLEQAGSGTDDLIIASANDAFCRNAGYSHEELIGRPLRSFAADDTAPDQWAELRAAALRSESFRSQLLLARKAGAPFWFGLHLMSVHSSKPPCFVVLGRDITARLQDERQQAAVQSLLAKVFLCVKTPVAIVTDSGFIQMTNPALDALLGYPPGSLVGKLAIELNAPSALEAARAARERQVSDGHDYTIATRLLHATGQEIPAGITSITVQREDLRRFRIITVLARSEGTPPVAVRVAGKIKLIGLEDVKEALGARWDAVAARVLATAEHVVHQRCGPQDSYSRTADAGFLICYGDASEEEAAFRAAMLAREIRNRLIGEGESEAASEVSAVAAAVHVSDVPGQSADMLAAAIGERLNRRLAEIEARARETLRLAVRTATCQHEPVRSLRTREVVAHCVRLPWQQEQSVLAAYSSLSMQERQSFDFDRLVLGLAAEHAITNIAEGAAPLTLVNVDFEVFLDRRRTERYVAACQQLDGRLRERLILVLSGMPKGFPKSRVLDCVMRLRPFCHGVGVQSDTMEPPALDLSSLGVSLIVLRDDRQSAKTTKDVERLTKQIDSLHAHQARVLVRHVESWLESKPFAAAGVDFISIAENGPER